jgi:hypothetical protein
MQLLVMNLEKRLRLLFWLIFMELIGTDLGFAGEVA